MTQSPNGKKAKAAKFVIATLMEEQVPSGAPDTTRWKVRKDRRDFLASIGYGDTLKSVLQCNTGRQRADSPGMRKGYQFCTDSAILESFENLVQQTSRWSRKMQCTVKAN